MAGFFIMSEPIKLIVGLGNPGREYEATRHNAGFWWVDELARAHGANFKTDNKFHGLSPALRCTDMKPICSSRRPS